MLIINGTAQYMLADGEKVQGDRHSINIFSKNDNLDTQLDSIDSYLMGLGWDNIVLTENGIIESIDGINHSVLMDAFKKAQNSGLAVVVNNASLYKAA